MSTRLGLIIGTVVALTSAAHAQQAPGWSRGQQELPITWEECVKRGNAALQAEGFRIDQPSPFVVGIKGVHTALIMCNPSPNNKQWVNIVVASNGEGGGTERQRLQARMEGQNVAPPTASAQPQPPPPPPATSTGREGCQAGEYSVSAPAQVRPKQDFTISFRSKGRMRDRDWISVYKLPNPAEKYYYWAYTTDGKLSASCSWTLSLHEPGQYGIAYLLDNGSQVLATTFITVTDSASAQIQTPPPATSPPPAQAKPVQYMGCFKDSNSPFDLDGYLERSGQNTPQRCIQTCAAKGFAYAGVQYGQSCLCGNRYGTQGQANNCNMACTGDGRSVCGGANANSVYSTGR